MHHINLDAREALIKLATHEQNTEQTKQFRLNLLLSTGIIDAARFAELGGIRHVFN